MKNDNKNNIITNKIYETFEQKWDCSRKLFLSLRKQSIKIIIRIFPQIHCGNKGNKNYLIRFSSEKIRMGWTVKRIYKICLYLVNKN